MIVLGIETSCDETAASVVKHGDEILSNVVYSQVVHHRYGGVVPELASRDHIRQIFPVVDEAIKNAGLGLDDIQGIAVTRGPGLVGSLLVGTVFAKTLSAIMSVPFVGVNHIEGHIFASMFADPLPAPPFVSFVISGGHCDLIYVYDWGRYRLLGYTLDDAPGEAFDKVAKLLYLGYPGGVEIQRIADYGDPYYIDFPKANTPGYTFSFSGLKTAVLYHIKKLPFSEFVTHIPDIAASFQRVVVEVLVEKAFMCCRKEGLSTLVFGGGVSANRLLRDVAKAEGEKSGIEVIFPPPKLSTDNAAMIASCGNFYLEAGRQDPLTLRADPGLRDPLLLEE